MVVKHASSPDARIVGGLFVYILPEHIWGKVPVKKLTGSYRPTLADRRQRALHRHRVPARADHPDDAQPELHGQEAGVRRGPVDQVRQQRRRRPRAHARRDRRRSPRSSSRRSRGSARRKDIKAISAPSPSFTELAFNLCSKKICPDAKFNPAVQDVTVRQAIAYAIDRNRINEIGTRGTAFVGHGLLPDFYKAFYTAAGAGLPARRRQGQPDARRGGLEERAATASAPRAARSSRSTSSCARSRAEHPVRAARARDDEADRRRLQGPDRERGQAHRAHHAEGQGQDGARTSTRSSGAGAATRTTRACCSTC